MVRIYRLIYRLILSVVVVCAGAGCATTPEEPATAITYKVNPFLYFDWQQNGPPSKTVCNHTECQGEGEKCATRHDVKLRYYTVSALTMKQEAGLTCKPGLVCATVRYRGDEYLRETNYIGRCIDDPERLKRGFR